MFLASALFRSRIRGTSKERPWTFFVFLATTVLLMSQQIAIGEEPTTPTVLAHPAMFGKRWSGVVTLEVRTVSADFCKATIIEGDEPEEGSNTNSFDPQTIEPYGVALFFDPYERSGNRECEYAEMAEVAEKTYPSVQYLLIASDNKLVAAADGYSETSLAVAIVAFEDGESIKNKFSDGQRNATLLDSGGILVSIDAVSRSIVDVCVDCRLDSQEEKLWATLTRATSVLSCIGSIYVLLSLAGTKARRSDHLGSIFNRLLLGISISDMISSVAMALATWAVPASPPGDYEGYYSQERWDSFFPGASGSAATCTAQGFSIHVGISGSTFFTGCVALQTLLIVRYSWTDSQMRKAETFFYLVSIGVPLITGIWAAVANLMNPLRLGFCWINSSPQECLSDPSGPIFDEYCDATIRGEDFFFYQIAFATVWILFTIVLIVGSLLSLFLFVRRQERRAARWSDNAQRGRQQRKVLTKAIMYISVYALIWIPTITSLVGGNVFSPSVAFTLVASLLPLQGFFNSLIYSGIIEKCLGRVCFGTQQKKPIQGRIYSAEPNSGCPCTLVSKGELGPNPEH